MTKKATSRRAECRSCRRVTQHDIKAVCHAQDDEEVDKGHFIWWRDDYEMLQCRGCGTACLRDEHLFSEWPDAPEVTFFPAPVSRVPPHWRAMLSSEMRALLQEVYAAMNSGSRRLALMGARAVMDMVILDQVGDVGTFQEKLAALEDAGFVGRKNREVLEAALDTGHAASHRGYDPPKDSLDNVMDIVENLLQAVYVLGRAATQLRAETPPRAKKAKQP